MADKIVVNSKDFKKEYKKVFNLNVNYIYNPLNKSEILKKSKLKIKIPLFKKRYIKFFKCRSIGRSKRSNHNIESSQINKS